MVTAERMGEKDYLTDIQLSAGWGEELPCRGHIEYHLGERLMSYVRLDEKMSERIRTVSPTALIQTTRPLVDLLGAIDKARKDLRWEAGNNLAEPDTQYELHQSVDALVTPRNSGTAAEYWAGYVS